MRTGFKTPCDGGTPSRRMLRAAIGAGIAVLAGGLMCCESEPVGHTKTTTKETVETPAGTTTTTTKHEKDTTVIPK